MSTLAPSPPMSGPPIERAFESAPGTYRTCVTCQRRTHRDEMLDEYECRRCHAEYIDKVQRRNLNQELAEKKKALGQAVHSMARSINAGQFVPDEPHVIFKSLLENFGGTPDGFAKLYRERYDAACEDGGSQKVAADILKSILVMSVEAHKTAPPPPDYSAMSDEEMADELGRLVQLKLQEIEELKLLQSQPVVADPLPEDRPDAADLLMAARQSVSQPDREAC